MNGVEKILGCNKACFPIKCLGVLIGEKKLKKKGWMEMIDKVQKKKKLKVGRVDSFRWGNSIIKLCFIDHSFI